MASIQKRGNKWYAQVRKKRLSKSKLHDTKKQAQAWAADIERQLGDHEGLVVGHTLGDAFKKYAKEESPRKKGARWEIIRLGKLEKDKIANISLLQLSVEDLQNWVDRQDLAPASVRREFQVLTAVLNACRKKWKWMEADKNLTSQVELPKKPPPRDRIATENEIDLILSALLYDGHVINRHHEVAVATLFALETGMRQGEIWKMDWRDIDLKKCFVRLYDTKNGYGRDVPLSSKAIKLLKKMTPQKEGGVFTVNQGVAGQIYRKAVKLAGIEDLTFHDLRHTAVTNLARKLSMLELARMIGHRDLRSLQIYYNETAEELAKKLG